MNKGTVNHDENANKYVPLFIVLNKNSHGGLNLDYKMYHTENKKMVRPNDITIIKTFGDLDQE